MKADCSHGQPQESHFPILLRGVMLPKDAMRGQYPQPATSQASPEAAQYETLGREDDALLVKMLAAGLPKLPAGQCAHVLSCITGGTRLARCWDHASLEILF